MVTVLSDHAPENRPRVTSQLRLVHATTRPRLGMLSLTCFTRTRQDPDMAEDVTVGFIGAGQMATALARGLTQAGVIPATSIVAYDPYPAALDKFQSSTQSTAVASNAAVLERADVIFLAVKPQSMCGVLAEIAPNLEPRHLLISIAAGITLATLARGVGEASRLVRVMPNTPCLVGAGASAYALGSQATEADGALVEKLLSTVGVTGRVPENLLDAVTGLSGSGPAFGYVIIEALSDAGVCAGLPRELSTRLAAQTMLGAAKMVLETRQHPGALKDAVASPGGTTIAGLMAMEQAGVRAGLMEAVVAAWERSRELSGN